MTKSTKVIGRAMGLMTRPKRVVRWVKYTCRYFFSDGTSKYCSASLGQFEGSTNKDSAEYLIRDFRESLSGEVVGVKLISVGGEKFNIMVA